MGKLLFFKMKFTILSLTFQSKIGSPDSFCLMKVRYNCNDYQLKAVQKGLKNAGFKFVL